MTLSDDGRYMSQHIRDQTYMQEGGARQPGLENARWELRNDRGAKSGNRAHTRSDPVLPDRVASHKEGEEALRWAPELVYQFLTIRIFRSKLARTHCAVNRRPTAANDIVTTIPAFMATLL